MQQYGLNSERHRWLEYCSPGMTNMARKNKYLIQKISCTKKNCGGYKKNKTKLEDTNEKSVDLQQVRKN